MYMFGRGAISANTLPRPERTGSRILCVLCDLCVECRIADLAISHQPCLPLGIVSAAQHALSSANAAAIAITTR
jgi:hypothetical protein